MFEDLPFFDEWYIYLSIYIYMYVYTVTTFKYVERCGGRARPRGPGGSMKDQFVYLNVVAACLNELAKENLPGGSLRYQFVFFF